MPAIFLMLIFVIITGTFLVFFSLGIGYILSKFIPGLGIGMGIIAGSILSVGTIDFLARVISAINEFDRRSNEGDEFEEPYIVLSKNLWKSSTASKKRKNKKK